MSYILDALKREQSEHANFALQQDHQQDYELAAKLKFYRKLAFGFGFVVAIGAGFAIGKTAQLWLAQPETQQEIAPAQLAGDAVKAESTPDATEAKIASQTQAVEKVVNEAVDKHQVQQVQQFPAGTQLVPVQVSNGAVMNMPVQYKLVPVQQIYQSHQMVPTYVQANGQLVAQYPQAIVANQQVVEPQMMQANSYMAANGQVVYQQPVQQFAPSQAIPQAQQPQQEPEPQTAKQAVSELAFAFQEAMEKVDKSRLSGREQVEVQQSSTTASNVQPIELLPDSIASRLPSIQYQAHIFASEPSRRWIKVNGKELYEGDEIQGMQVVEITRDVTVFSYQGYEFAVSALNDWN